ncbi:hypothetical protein K9M16_01505 [Candidatus Babeliales bacterium]|nr:hypothetical protein [Candidatus Babeliales bacterium]
MAKNKNNKKFLIFLFIFSFFIRSIIFYCFLSKNNNYWNYDSFVYHNVAVQISNGNGISNYPGTPNFLRVPGYSLFLASCYKVFDFLPENIFSKDKILALWVQIFIASFIPILIFFLSLVLIPNIWVAKIAAIISATHLGFVLFSGLLMTESLFIFFLLLFFIFFLKNFNIYFCKKIINPNYLHFFLSGIFLGITSLFRPVGQQLVIIAFLLLLCSSFYFLTKIKTSLILFLGWFLIVFWWLLRNYLLTSFIFFHTLSGIHFFKHMAARIYSEDKNISYMDSLNKLNIKFDKYKNRKLNQDNKFKLLAKNFKNLDLSDIQNCKLLEKFSAKICKKNLFLTAKHAVINMLKTCFSLYSAELIFIYSNKNLPDYANRSVKNIFFRFLKPDISNLFVKIIIYIEIILFFLLLLGFGIFLIKSFFIKSYFCLFCKLFPIIFLFIFVSLGCGFARLRLPIESFLIILSVNIWFEIFRGKREIHE